MTNVLRGIGPHWRLAVHTKPVGYMGTWRLSGETGLPFSGRHRVHQPDLPAS